MSASSGNRTNARLHKSAAASKFPSSSSKRAQETHGAANAEDPPEKPKPKPKGVEVGSGETDSGETDSNCGARDALDLKKLTRWLAHRQGAVEGGFAGRTNKLVDGCYSFWQGGAFPVLGLLLGSLSARERGKDGETREVGDSPNAPASSASSHQGAGRGAGGAPSSAKGLAAARVMTSGTPSRSAV